MISPTSRTFELVAGSAVALVLTVGIGAAQQMVIQPLTPGIHSATPH